MSGIFDTFSGSITGELLTFNPDAIPEPDTLHIRMTRGERCIADELRKAFGGFKRVVIDVDGEQYEFKADSLIRLLEGYEGEPGTRYSELFGTPETAAGTMARQCFGATSEECNMCVFGECDGKLRNSGAYQTVYDALLEWLRGDA